MLQRFSPVTVPRIGIRCCGAAAIEDRVAFVFGPPAKTGDPWPANKSQTRGHYGHSLVVPPWGEVAFLDAVPAPGIYPFNAGTWRVYKRHVPRVPSPLQPAGNLGAP